MEEKYYKEYVALTKVLKVQTLARLRLEQDDPERTKLSHKIEATRKLLIAKQKQIEDTLGSATLIRMARAIHQTFYKL